MIDKIRFYCKKIIPLVYDDSLSYYETLCKVKQKLNEVVDTVNEELDEENLKAIIAEEISKINLTAHSIDSDEEPTIDIEETEPFTIDIGIPKGIQGEDGEQGEQGETGEQGKSIIAYLEEINNTTTMCYKALIARPETIEPKINDLLIGSNGGVAVITNAVSGNYNVQYIYTIASTGGTNNVEVINATINVDETTEEITISVEKTPTQIQNLITNGKVVFIRENVSLDYGDDGVVSYNTILNCVSHSSPAEEYNTLLFSGFTFNDDMTGQHYSYLLGNLTDDEWTLPEFCKLTSSKGLEEFQIYIYLPDDTGEFNTDIATNFTISEIVDLSYQKPLGFVPKLYDRASNMTFNLIGATNTFAIFGVTRYDITGDNGSLVTASLIFTKTPTPKGVYNVSIIPLTVDSTPTENSPNLITSGGVYDFIQNTKAKAQTVSIAVADWSGGTTCTKSVTGVTATSIVIVDTSDGSVECTGQGNGTLTFTANSTPTSAVTVKVVIL